MSSGIEISLLGPPAYCWMGSPIRRFAAHADEELLVYLALHSGEYVSRRIVQDRIWPEQGGDSARTAVTRALSRLRHLGPGPCDCKWSHGDRIGLCTHVRVDVVEFNQLASSDSLEERVSAVKMWRERPLDGIDLDWADAYRMRLELEYRGLLMRTVPELSGEGRHAEARHYAHVLITLDPLDEEAARIGIAASGAAGRPNEAQAIFDALRRHLADELGTQPEQATRDALARALGRKEDEQAA